jgi:uncharacterized protein (TIGR02118 family)
VVRFLVLYNQPEDREAFERHYREVHIPLAKKLPGLRRYSISRNMQAIRGGESFYLIAELEWDDLAAMQQSFQSPEGQATSQDVSEHLSRLSPGVRSMVYELEDVVDI